MDDHQTGWMCPRCKLILAPSVPMCKCRPATEEEQEILAQVDPPVQIAGNYTPVGVKTTSGIEVGLETSEMSDGSTVQHVMIADTYESAYPYPQIKIPLGEVPSVSILLMMAHERADRENV